MTKLSLPAVYLLFLPYFGVFILATAVLTIQHFLQRTETTSLLLLWATAWIGFGLAYRFANGQATIYRLLVLGAILRFALVGAFPNLSDDIYRFIWDGRLLADGVHPFATLPSKLMQQIPLPSGIDLDLYNRLNSKHYFTIYPPLMQAIFWLAAKFGGNTWVGAATTMQLFLWLCEVGTLCLLPILLRRLSLPPQNALLYALNPLPMLEIVGNIHFEGAMIFFTMLSLACLLVWRQRDAAAMAMAMAIGAKLLPLMWLPLLMRRLGAAASLRFFAVVGAALALLFLPMLNGDFVRGFAQSLDLYFRKFEFNASLYYLLRWVGFRFVGYNLNQILSPLLSLIVLFGVIRMSLKLPKNHLSTFPADALQALSLYFFCAAIVHPWYLTTLVALAALTPAHRYPIVWSASAFFTYTAYQNPDHFAERFEWIILEYLAVLVAFIWQFAPASIKHKINNLFLPFKR